MDKDGFLLSVREQDAFPLATLIAEGDYVTGMRVLGKPERKVILGPQQYALSSFKPLTITADDDYIGLGLFIEAITKGSDSEYGTMAATVKRAYEARLGRAKQDMSHLYYSPVDSEVELMVLSLPNAFDDEVIDLVRRGSRGAQKLADATFRPIA